MLDGYWSGVPSTSAQGRRFPYFLQRQYARYSSIPIAEAHARWLPLVPGLRRLGEAVLPRPLAAVNDFWACRLFDRWVAQGLTRCQTAGVIACEISALTTFSRARKRGLTTILDAPSFHHLTQDRVDGTRDSARLHRRIATVKDREIELADHILTVSELARQSYVRAGVPADRVHALELGADLDLFHPPADRERRKGRIRFVFAGAAIRRKGIDLLIAAFDRIATEGYAAELRLVGPPIETVPTSLSAGVQVIGTVDQTMLAEELRNADCLVLPSRHDSFGMVVPEALASGTPVLVSDMVGAQSLVTPGRTGWIVTTNDLNSLAAQMRWCAENLDAVRRMGPECRAAVQTATWPSYRKRLVDLLRTMVPANRQS
jgi:glycosyltransferase involved in cell wall biosynthesis